MRHDDTRFNDRFEPIRLIREEEEGGGGGLIRISREPIFYAKFSTRRFHRSRTTDNRLKYSERAGKRGRKGGRKYAAPLYYTIDDKEGRVKKRRARVPRAETSIAF